MRYRLAKPVSAVELEEHPGSSLRDPTNHLVEIPANVVVEVEGVVDSAGLVNVLWSGVAFSVFYEDLTERAHIVGAQTN